MCVCSGELSNKDRQQQKSPALRNITELGVGKYIYVELENQIECGDSCEEGTGGCYGAFIEKRSLSISKPQKSFTEKVITQSMRKEEERE